MGVTNSGHTRRRRAVTMERSAMLGLPPQMKGRSLSQKVASSRRSLSTSGRAAGDEAADAFFVTFRRWREK